MGLERLLFIDWMKCLGMALIVLGHLGGSWNSYVTQPFYPKQLGVAFFLFVTGYSLAGERRSGPEVLFKRLFEVYLFGIAFSVLLSAITFMRISDLSESNYLPFLLGANLVLNAFPANPTTWYIGTYVHIIILWVMVLKHVRAQIWMLIPVGLAEIAFRAVLMERALVFPAYMLLTNWASVFLLGMIIGQRRSRSQGDYEENRKTADVVLPLAVLGLLIVVWPVVASRFDFQRTFPLMSLARDHGFAGCWITSAFVTLLYAAYTWSTYQITRRLRESTPVRFIARNTLLIFIGHMPIIYALREPLQGWIENPLLCRLVLFLVCFVGLAVGSEIVRQTVQPTRLRDRIWSRMQRCWPTSRASLHQVHS